MRGCSAALKMRAGEPASRMWPPSMKTTVSATSRAKPISCGDDHQRRAGARQLLDDIEHFADQFRIERRCRLIEQQHLRAQRQGAGDGDALLLAAGELARIGIDLVAEARRGPAAPAPSCTASSRLTPRTWIGASMRFSSTVRCGKRLKFWNTMPISARRFRISFSLRLVEHVAVLLVADELAIDRR